MKAKHFMTVPALASLVWLVGLPAVAHVCERETTRLFSLTETSIGADGSRIFRVRGMSTGGFGVCDKPKTKIQRDILILKVPKTFVFHGLNTGPYFDVTIIAPSTVRKIVFGKNEQEIWPTDKARRIKTAEEDGALSLAKKKFLEECAHANLNDYSVEVRQSKKVPSLFFVSFLHWIDGRPVTEASYKVDNSSNEILKE